jgi:hypothetical protein
MQNCDDCKNLTIIAQINVAAGYAGLLQPCFQSFFKLPLPPQIFRDEFQERI